MAAQKAEKAEKTEKPTCHAEIQIRASMLRSLALAFKSIGFATSGGVLVEFYKKGIILRMEDKNELLGAIAISSKALAGYKSTGGFKTVLNHDNILTLKGWSEGKKESIPLLLKILDNNITMKYENVSTRTKHNYFGDVFESVEKSSKLAMQTFNELTDFGTLNSEEFVFAIERIAKLKPDEYAPDYSRIESDGKTFTYYRELGQADEVEVEIKNERKAAKARKTTDKALFETKTLADIVGGFCPLAPSIMIKGAAGRPLVLTGAGYSLEALSLFEHDIEYFVILAPKVEEK